MSRKGFTKEGFIWNSHKDDILLKEISKNPGNLVLAFKNAHKLLGICPRTCGSRWYNHLRKDETVFKLYSIDTELANTKITKKTTPKKDTTIINKSNSLISTTKIDNKSINIEIKENEIIITIKK